VRLQARVGPLLAELAQAGETEGPPRGRLRVSAPTLLSDNALGPIAVSFARVYPEVSLEITAENRMVELPADGYDLVIRVDPAPQERLVGRCVLRDERWLVAAPGVPRPAEGAGDPPPLPVIVHVPPKAGAVWTVCEGNRTLRFSPQVVLRLSSLPMQRAAVLIGGGAALLPRSLVGQDVSAGRLVRWGSGKRSAARALGVAHVEAAGRSEGDSLRAASDCSTRRKTARGRNAGLRIILSRKHRCLFLASHCRTPDSSLPAKPLPAVRARAGCVYVRLRR